MTNLTFDMHILSKSIKKHRKKKSITLEMLSQITGIHIGTLSEYENAKRRPNLTNLAKICKALGVTFKINGKMLVETGKNEVI